MRRLLALVQSTRVYLALFTVPPAALWISSPDGEESGLGAWATLLLIAHSLLVICHATGFDAATLAAGRAPRFALSRDHDLYLPEVSSVSRWISAGLVAVLALLMIVARPTATIEVLVALGLVVGLTGGVGATSRKFRLMFVEVLWPVAMIVLPMVLVKGLRHSAMPPGAVPISVVFALMVSCYVLLCEIRDLPLDAGEGMRTMATVAGRGVVTALVFLAMGATILVATRAATMGYWHWSAPGVLAMAALVCLWSLPSRNEDAAPALWVLASGYAALVALTA